MADGESWSVNNCANCANMNLKDRCSYDSSKAWCGYYRTYYPPTDRACSGHFIYDASRESLVQVVI